MMHITLKNGKTTHHALTPVEFFSLIHANVFNFRLDDIKQITFDDSGKVL
jgi:hypothetical protein